MSKNRLSNADLKRAAAFQKKYFDDLRARQAVANEIIRKRQMRALAFIGIAAIVAACVMPDRVDPDAPPAVYLTETTCQASGRGCTTEYKTNPEYLGWVAKQKWLEQEALEAQEEEIDCDVELCDVEESY